MEKCLVIINKDAGKARKCTPEKVANALDNKFDFDTIYIPTDNEIDFSGYRHIVVCGGDGTLSRIMKDLHNTSKSVYYYPCGTLNDKGKTKQKSGEKTVVGKVGDGIFTYVYATGAFTPLGYAVNNSLKRKFGVLAYILKIIENYQVNRINATVEIFDDKEKQTDLQGKSCAPTATYSGEFNLVMFLKSPRCFGFKFNRGYDADDESGHLIMIHSPRHNGIRGKVEMFFPFFRVFFIGLNKEKDGNIVYKKINNCRLNLPDKAVFCADGERDVRCGQTDISFAKTKCQFTTLNRKTKSLSNKNNKSNAYFVKRAKSSDGVETT